MYYGYIDDDTFKSTSTVSLADRVYPACALDRTIGNYFHENVKVTDPRPNRRSFKDYLIKPCNVLKYHYDASKHETSLFDVISQLDTRCFFNIVERVLYSNGEVLGDIEADLLTDADFNGYVSQSLTRSATSVTVQIPQSNVTWSDSTKTDVIPTIQMVIPTYFEFTVKFAQSDAEKIRIYCTRQYFLDNYPLSTVCAVVLPCDHKYLLNPSLSSGVIDMLIKSNEFSFSELDPEIEGVDHTGLITYYTKFVTSSPAASNLLPIGILYQGHEPSSLEIRKAIRTKILGYGTAPQATWEDILPDLFVEAQFFIVPIWDNITLRPERILYPSVINLEKLREPIKLLFPDVDETFITKYHEVLTCGQSEIFLTSIPDILNEKEFSILKKHPTYQYHMSNSSAYQYQDVTTRDFNARLNRCMSVAMGETTLADIVTNTIDDKLWYSFVSTNTEYHVLSKESYTTFFATTE